MIKQIILSGMQPTGELHLGNYLGALKNFVKLQDEYDSYFFIASYHSMTAKYDIKTKKQDVINLAKTYLAAGVDPKKAVIFDQFDTPIHMELYWIFNTLTPIAEAERMTQFKDKSAKNSNNINLGLLTYPILQAADILMYHSTHIPVGVDQVQHVELTRKVARWFNNRYGEYFTEPDPVLTSTPKIQSLQNPEKKMSKSDGENAYLGILDEPAVLQKKINKAVTGIGDENKIPAGAANLLNILSELGRRDLADKYQNDIDNKLVSYGDLKKDVYETVNKYLTPIREKYKKITDKEVEKVLKDGAKKANQVAKKTMEEVRKLVGIT